MADYLNCSSSALTNEKDLEDIMKEACTKAKATVLKIAKYSFQPTGFSIILLLAESHATIHTYPECNSCFVDFFTCGTTCSPEIFHEILKNYLKPKEVREKFFLREEEIKEHLNAQSCN